MDCERCGRTRHNVRDEDEKLCWTCRREARRKEKGYAPREGRKRDDPNMARVGASNVWTKLTQPAAAWLLTMGKLRREQGLTYREIRDELEERYKVHVTIANVMNILAGRAWKWMTNPEEYADGKTKRQLRWFRKEKRPLRALGT